MYKETGSVFGLGCIMMVFSIGLSLAFIAAAVWVVVWVLQSMHVI